MSRVSTPRKRRPPIRLVLVVMLLIAMATPFVGLFFLRVVENQLIRRTEAELISQSAAIAPVFGAVIARAPIEDSWFGPEPEGDFNENRAQGFLPLPPRLDLATAEIRPPRPDAEPSLSPLTPPYREAGKAMIPIVAEVRRRTLAGIVLLDSRGRITDGPDVGMSLAHVAEVKAALAGEFAAVLRRRLRKKAPPLIYSFTKGASLRVFTAYPVIVRNRVAGVIYASRTPRHVLQMMAAERGKLMFAGIAMLLAVAAFAVVAKRAITGPIHALTERTRRIAAGEREALEPLEAHGTAEVAELSEAFLRTARQLHDRSDDLAAFAANVSHELKSPLTAIQGAAELIRDNEDVMNAEERRSFLDNIINDSQRMALLVRRLLELARAETRGAAIGASTVADIEVSLRENAALAVEIDDIAAPSLAIDAEKLEIILANLADNAARHGAKLLTISVKPSEGEATIDVIDDGEGISPKNQSRVFEPFFTTRRAKGGTGMGLPIIKALLEARGGDIELLPFGQGAHFRIRLPMAQA